MQVSSGARAQTNAAPAPAPASAMPLARAHARASQHPTAMKAQPRARRQTYHTIGRSPRHPAMI
eukprot:9609622-Alexandrium_andersonii.AAC.1